MKRACVDSLAAALKAALPPTVDVGACAADWEEPTKFPAVRILPGKFTFDSWQEEEVDDTQADKLFLQVGEFVGNVEIRVSARSRREREVVEDLVTHYFLERPYTPGTQITILPEALVGGCVTSYKAFCAFTLEDSDWREEMVFSSKRFSFLDVEATFPALIVRKNVFTIEQLVLVLEADVRADVNVVPTDPTTIGGEDLIVNEDGTTTPTNL